MSQFAEALNRLLFDPQSMPDQRPAWGKKPDAVLGRPNYLDSDEAMNIYPGLAAAQDRIMRLPQGYAAWLADPRTKMLHNIDFGFGGPGPFGFGT
jgi:hypothetical protein